MSEGHSSAVFSKLYRYAMIYKRRLAAAMALLLLALGSQLMGPMLAKQIIDGHILAIEKVWYEAEPETVAAGQRFVSYRNKVYIREDWHAQGAPEGGLKAAIRQTGGAFVLESPSFGELRLSAGDVKIFYRYEIRPVVMLVGFLIALTLIAGCLGFWQSYLFQTTALRIVRRLRCDIFKHMHSLPIRFFDDKPAGQIVSRISNDTESIKGLYISFMSTFMVSGLQICGILVAMFLLNARLAMLCLLLVPIYTILIYVHLKYSRKYVVTARSKLVDMTSMLNESIRVMPILQAFRSEKARLNQFGTLNEERYRTQVKQYRIFAFSSRNAVYFIGRLFTAGVIWHFGGQSLESAISFGVLFAFIDYLGRIFDPVISIFDQLAGAQTAYVAAERAFEIMDEEPAEPGRERMALARPKGHVSMEKVIFGYKPGETVLKEISIEAHPGQTIAIVGHTGAGKSSIINLLLGFYEPVSGTIRIDGRDMRELPKRQLRQYIGMVLQDSYLFTGDIRSNVNLNDESISEDRVRKALRDVGALAFVERLESGLDAPVTEWGGSLSAGQRQLISFARALACDPAIVILDEATSSVDSETEAVIREALDVVRGGRTTFIIAHRLSTITHADCILVLHRGEIVERGTHEELLEREGRYSRMFRLQNERPQVVS